MITGDVERFELPNLHALNFLLHGALDGGGTLVAQDRRAGEGLLDGAASHEDRGVRQGGRHAGAAGSGVPVTRLLQIRLAIAILGLVVFGYGYAVEQPKVRLAGIVLLAISLVLRFVPDRKGKTGDPTN